MGDSRLPPHDLEAEAAVLSAVMLDPAALDTLLSLRPEHFYSERHRQIFAAALDVRASSRPVDLVTIASELRDRGRLEQAGGSVYLQEILDAAAVLRNVAAYAATVIELWQRRQIIRTAQELAAAGYAGGADAANLAALATATLGRFAGATARSDPWYVVERAPELAAPLPDLSWLCQPLRLARASLTILGGYGYARKTLYAQALALAVASGRPALGLFRVDRAPVVHVDYEQGQRLTRERYQRLARAANIELGDTSLHVVTFPRFRLTDPGARDVLRRLLEETRAGLLLIDSLRAAVTGVEENNSEIREYIDLVGQECKRVEAAAMIIHHARKPSQEKNGAGVRYALRGSGAIFDAGDELFMLAGEKGQPTTVTHEKDRLAGSELEDFGLDSEDVTQDGDPRWGLRIVHLEPEQLRQMREREEERRQRERERRGVTAVTAPTPDASSRSSRRPLPPGIG